MSGWSKETIRENAQKMNVKFVRLQFTDIFGGIKNVEVPISQLDKALNNQIMFDGSSIEGFVRIEESDMYLYPDLNTWKIFPWTLGTDVIASLVCDIYLPSGEPFVGDPRNNLKRVIKEMEALGYSAFNVGPEPEFFLLKMSENNIPLMEMNDNGGYFDFAPLDLGENCRRDIVIELEKMAFEIEASHHEVGMGQHEIDFKYADALSACDNIQMFKLVVKTVARKHNLHATFMAKPFYSQAGSGMHCNISLFKNGENVFYDEQAPKQLSAEANFFMAGLLHYARNFTAITNPTVNSYKRLVPDYEAPCYVAWSWQNRSPLIRVPSARGASTRIEIRSVDPMANPYLALAALLTAGLEGIKKKLLLPDPVNCNIYEMSNLERNKFNIVSLPNTLDEALKYLKAEPLIKRSLGEHIFNNFVEAKQLEWKKFHNEVHPWELENYLNLY